MFERILVVLDPARDLESARRYAIEIAKRWRPSVVALYNVFEEAAPFKVAYSEGVKPKQFVGKRILKEFEEDLRKVAGKDIELTKVVEEGPYEVAIPSVAAREEVDLLVLGSFHTKMERALVGSDTERIIEYSPCSVLLVRDPRELPEEGSLLAFAHDNTCITPRAALKLVGLAMDLGTTVQTVLGVTPKRLDEGKKASQTLDELLKEAGIMTGTPQVLTSRWILGPHGVVHRAVAGYHPSMAVLSRYMDETSGNATHWLVHEFVADTPCPMLFMK